jgi:hypothetical protein
MTPFELAFDGGTRSSLEQLFPLEKLVCKAQMRLDDDIETTCPHKAVCPGKGHVHGAHDLGDANGGTAGDAYPAMNKGRCSPFAASICSGAQED